MREAARRSWNDHPLRSKGLLVVAIPLAALVLISLGFVITARKQPEAAAALAWTLAITAELEATRRLTVDAESGVRGHLLVGDTLPDHVECTG